MLGLGNIFTWLGFKIPIICLGLEKEKEIPHSWD